ncbi:MAG: PEGA domain-containing protein [Deltaproteobacteria bacterium]|nr:PEGA domain-containing protein [Deltaproteobacteria bacterium]
MNRAYARRAMASATTLFVCLLPALAAAQTDLGPEAQWRFNRGLSLVKDNAFVEAAVEFKRAHEISGSFSVLLNLGQAHAAAGQPVQAVEALGQYLRDGGAQVPQVRREEAEALIAEQEGRIATIIVRCDPSGAEIRVDGNQVGKCPLPGPVRLVAGSHTLAVSLADHKPQEHKLELAGKEQKVVDVRLEASGAAAVAAGQDASAAPTLVSPSGGAPWWSRKRAAHLVGGIGVASLAVGAVFGVRAITKRLDSNRHCPQDQCTQEGVDLNNQAKTAARVADVTIGVGLVGVVVAAYLLVRPGGSSTTSPGTTAFGMDLCPELGPGEAKVALRGTW